MRLYLLKIEFANAIMISSRSDIENCIHTFVITSNRYDIIRNEII